MNATPARYWKRKDDSLGMSFGDPFKGYHEQFDFEGSEELAAFIVKAVNSHEALVGALDECREAIAMMIEPNSIQSTSVAHAFATANAAEVRARSLLATLTTEGNR